jgi:hypothetical protein
LIEAANGPGRYEGPESYCHAKRYGDVVALADTTARMNVEVQAAGLLGEIDLVNPAMEIIHDIVESRVIEDGGWHPLIGPPGCDQFLDLTTAGVASN